MVKRADHFLRLLKFAKEKTPSFLVVIFDSKEQKGAKKRKKQQFFPISNLLMEKSC